MRIRGWSPRMRKNFNLAAMKGELAREAKWKFSMRGGLFAYFLPKQKVREICHMKCFTGLHLCRCYLLRKRKAHLQNTDNLKYLFP